MDPHPPFDHPHHRRAAHPGHHYLDQQHPGHHHHHHHHHLAGGGGAAPARSRYDYEYDSRPIQYPPPDHHHHHHPFPRVHQQPPPPPPPLPPPPPPPPHHRHDTPHYAPLPLRPTPETYSPPPYHNPPPPHQLYHQQRHGGGGDFRPVDEIRRIPSHHPQHHHHHQQPQHHHHQPQPQPQHHHHHHQPQHLHQQPQLSWEEAEEGRRYAAHQLKQQLSWEQAEEERRYSARQLRVSLSPPGARKRYRSAMHDSGDLESTSSSGPPLRRQRQQPHLSYSPPPDDSFVDRATSYSCYGGHEGFVPHSDSNGNKKMPMSMSAMLPGSPRRAPQKTAPMRVSVWHRIEENPSLYTPPSPRKVPKEVHISPSKTKNSGSGSKELASIVSLDCKAKSSDCKGSDDSAGLKKNAAKKTEKVLSSVLVKPSPEDKEKERAVNKVTKKPDKIGNNIPGFTSAGVRPAAFPGPGVKKVKKIVIKKIVRKIGAKDKQTSSSTISEKDSIDANVNASEKEEANANVSEKEEGEITTSSFEKDAISAHNLVSDTAGVANSVEVQKEQNKDLVNLRKNNATSTIASMDTLDTSADTLDTSASRRKHPGTEEEDYKSFVNSIDDGSPAIESTKTFNTDGVEHTGKEDTCFINSTVKNATLHCENNNSQQEEEGEIQPVSGPMNVASSCPRILDAVEPHDCEVEIMEDNKIPEVLSGNSAVYVNGAKDCTTEVSGNENDRREEGLNDPIGSPSTDEVSLTLSKDNHEKQGMILIGPSEVCAASVGQPEGNPEIAEGAVAHGARKEEGNLLNNRREKDVASFGSWGILNTTEINVNEITQEKEWRMPIEPNEATSFAHHVKAMNTSEINASDNIQKESQMPMDSSAFQTIKCAEAPNTIDVVSSKFAQNVACKSPMDLNGTNVGTSENSLYTPEFAVAGGTEDSSMKVDFNDVKAALNKPDLPLEVVDTDTYHLQLSRDTESTILPSLDDDPMKDSSGAVNLNNGVGRSASSQVAELTHLHRPHPPPDYNPSTLHSHDSPSVSGNSEHAVPTALTLGNNIYFSRAESEGQPEENRNLVDVNQGFDVTMTEFGKIVKRKGESGNDFMNAGSQNWLTLPLTVSCLDNDASRSNERCLEQIVDEGASVCQDHDSMPDIDQRDSIDILSGQDDSLKLCGISMPQADLLATEERNKDVEDEIGLPGSSVNSVNVLDQYSYHTVDKPIDNLNKPILLSSQSADAPGRELASPQVSVDSDHTYHGSTEDPVGVSSTTPDSISSWIEAIVSEAKKEHQSCKSSLLPISSPDKVLAPKEDSKKAFSDSVVNSVVKSPPQINIASSTVSKVPTKQVAVSGSLREPPRLNQNARNRTWRRDNASSSNPSLHVSQASGLPPKLPVKKNSKSQNSYIRKGNALIRNPATGNHLHSSSLDSQNKLSKPVMRRSMNFVRKVDSKDVAHSHISVERPKTPPLPLHTKSISCAVNVLEPLSQNLQQQVLETEKEDSSGQVNSGADNPSIISLHKSETLDAGKAIYVRPKLNQLVVAQGQHLGESSNISLDKVTLLQPSTTSDLYFKKRKNQIILGPSTSDAPSSKDTSHAENIKSGESTAAKDNIAVAKDRPHKALQTTNTVRSFSHVWTLSGQNPRKKCLVGASHMKVFPRILPWKRKIFCQNFRGSSYSSLLNTSSIGIMRKLLETRKRSTIYTVSTDGFSLRKSGVLSMGGSSLKWSRSLEKHYQKINEEATQAVAEVERKKREKRKRQSLHNKGGNDGYSASVAANQLTNSSRASSVSRVSACNEYVRVNKGNQLVRNPKKVIRMLASEKVRWSLHTVRRRLAKKQQYCQFFTRFGECKKSGGKCPYIHDRAKVAICTKFLRGSCSSTSCKLTHKVLPERMPDCSYFLQGLCTNTACPYRHVKVNSNAPACEDFLKGYCADGDECRKKHSYVCPVFEATGECPQESRCKLHHPKKKNKSKRSKVDTVQNNSWGRYFETSIGCGSGSRIVSLEEEERQKPEQVSGEDVADFIELGADIEVPEDADASDDIQPMELDSGNLEADNLDAIIKPLRIMRTARV